MKFLIDANISWRICKSLQAYVAECIHVDYCKLRVPAKDFEIWEFAKTHNYIIITNYEDFINLSTLYGFPPKIVVLKLLAKLLCLILMKLGSSFRLILIRFI